MRILHLEAHAVPWGARYKGTVISVSLLLCAAVLAFPSDHAAYRKAVTRALERAQTRLGAGLDFEVDHSEWNDPWVVTSAHYEVRATESYLQTVELAKSQELMRNEFVTLLGEGNAKPGIQKVWVFPRMADYNKFGNDFGEEHSSYLGSFHAVSHPEQPVVAYQNGNWKLLGMWVTHGVLHQFLAQNFGVQAPAFVDEGLASYFALFWDWQYGADQLELMKKSRRLVALERIVREPLQAYGERAGDRFLQLGMLFRFLLLGCEATRTDPALTPPSGPFQAFLRDAVRGKNTGSSEFQQIFEQDSGLIEDDFLEFDFSKL
jgi:hypothetical protein